MPMTDTVTDPGAKVSEIAGCGAGAGGGWTAGGGAGVGVATGVATGTAVGGAEAAAFWAMVAPAGLVPWAHAVPRATSATMTPNLTTDMSTPLKYCPGLQAPVSSAGTIGHRGRRAIHLPIHCDRRPGPHEDGSGAECYQPCYRRCADPR